MAERIGILSAENGLLHEECGELRLAQTAPEQESEQAQAWLVGERLAAAECQTELTVCRQLAGDLVLARGVALASQEERQAERRSFAVNMEACQAALRGTQELETNLRAAQSMLAHETQHCELECQSERIEKAMVHNLESELRDQQEQRDAETGLVRETMEVATRKIEELRSELQESQRTETDLGPLAEEVTQMRAQLSYSNKHVVELRERLANEEAQRERKRSQP